MSLAHRSLLSMADLAASELTSILDLAERLKSDPALMAGSLTGCSAALVFEKPSLRTKSSFMVASARLGLHAVHFAAAEVDLGRRESMADGARVLGRYFDLVVHRTHDHDRVVELAAHAGVPVINALSAHEHPCQALGDLLTIRERFGTLEGLGIAWVGDGNNVCHSLMLAAALAGARFCLATPAGHEADPAVVEAARRAGGEVRVAGSPAEAVLDAHVVSTDTWTSMGQEEEAAARRSTFAGFTVDAALMERARDDAIFLHCLPAHRGEEVTDDVLDGAASAVLDQAENRLWAQAALMALVLEARLPG